MRISTILLFAAADLSLFGGAAKADQILVNFTSTVISVSDPNHHLTTAVNTGDTITGTVTYDTAVPGFLMFGVEELFNASPPSPYYFNIAATVDGITFQSSANYYEQDVAQVTDYQFADLRAAVPAQVTGYTNPAVTSLQLVLSGSTTHPLDQPLSLGPLSSYSYMDFQIQYNVLNSNDPLIIDSTLTSLSTTDLGSGAPEPSAILLACAGFGFAAVAARKTTRKECKL